MDTILITATDFAHVYLSPFFIQPVPPLWNIQISRLYQGPCLHRQVKHVVQYIIIAVHRILHDVSGISAAVSCLHPAVALSNLIKPRFQLFISVLGVALSALYLTTCRPKAVQAVYYRLLTIEFVTRFIPPVGQAGLRGLPTQVFYSHVPLPCMVIDSSVELSPPEAITDASHDPSGNETALISKCLSLLSPLAILVQPDKYIIDVIISVNVKINPALSLTRYTAGPAGLGCQGISPTHPR